MPKEDKYRIQTMKKDQERLKNQGGVLDQRKLTEERAKKAEKILKIEEDILKKHEEKIKEETDSLLDKRKKERMGVLKEKIREKKEVFLDKEIKVERKEKPNVGLLQVEDKEGVRPIVVKKDLPKERLSQEKKALGREKIKLREKLFELTSSKKPLVAKKESILFDLARTKESFNPIILKERAIEEAQKTLEAKELTTELSSEKKKIEQERWKIEEKRRDIEQKRWPWDEKIKKLDLILDKLEDELIESESKELDLNNRIDEITLKEEQIGLEIEKIDILERVEEAKKIRVALEKEMVKIKEQVNQIKIKFDGIIKQEETIEQKKKIIEDQEANAKDLDRKRSLEQERWKIEEKRRTIEKERWEADETQNTLKKKLEAITGRAGTIYAREKDLLDSITEIDKKLGIKPLEEFKKEQGDLSISTPTNRDSRLAEAQKRIEALKGLKKKHQPEAGPPKAEAKKEPEEALIKSNREKLLEEDKRRKDILGRLKSPLSVQRKSNVLPKPDDFVKNLPKKPSGSQKMLVRMVLVGFIVIILTAILTFWYWYFRVRNEYVPPVETQEDFIEVPTNSIFSDSVTINLNQDQKIFEVIAEALKNPGENGQFKGIVLKRENKEISLKDFTVAMSMTMPASFYEKVEDKFSLFSYLQDQGNRLGMLVKIVDRNQLSDILKIQETTMEEDLALFFEVTGQDSPAVVSFFQNSSDVDDYEGLNFRYKTINKNDLGIIYGLSNDYFILTSSWQSTEALLNSLNKN